MPRVYHGKTQGYVPRSDRARILSRAYHNSKPCSQAVQSCRYYRYNNAWLRHANAAVMVRLGLTDKTAMARGGWSSNYTFKQIYAYVFPEDEADAAKQIDDYISGLLIG